MAGILLRQQDRMRMRSLYIRGEMTTKIEGRSSVLSGSLIRQFVETIRRRLIVIGHQTGTMTALREAGSNGRSGRCHGNVWGGKSADQFQRTLLSLLVEAVPLIFCRIIGHPISYTCSPFSIDFSTGNQTWGHPVESFSSGFDWSSKTNDHYVNEHL